MTPRPTSPGDTTAMVVVIITLDPHIASAVERARGRLRDEIPGLELCLHCATSFSNPAAIDACVEDIGRAHIVFANMLFIEEHIRAVLPALEARRDTCDAMVCAMSAGEVMRLTRMGSFTMDGSKKGPLALLKKLRGSGKKNKKDGGSGQMAMLRRLPKLLKYIPGKAQDLRGYLLTLAYWTSGSADNLTDLVRLLVHRYADGERKHLRKAIDPQPPRQYPETGLYHPRLEGRLTEDLDELPRPKNVRGTVGVLLLRSYVLGDDSAHYDRVIEALERRGYAVRAAFAAGLDARPAIDSFFVEDGPRGERKVAIDALVSLTGFSLVGGPAFNDAKAAEDVLAELNVPYLAAQPLEFQSVEQWADSSMGMTPIEATLMVSIPELDGATNPIVFGGRSSGDASKMIGIDERVETLAARVDRYVSLRQAPTSERNVAIVLFNFPPGGGAVGTAAYLSVFASLHRTLTAMAEAGYDVEVPPTVEALKDRLLGGNASLYGTDANVVATIPAETHVRREPHLAAIEKQWGPAPGKQLTDGASIFVLGARFGRVLVALQPGFGFEGDPMRLLHESGFAPTHAFSAFYRHLREDFAAHAVLHFGTHGALEFMPGKQVGLGAGCWPDRLIGDLPNLYLYASNNPSEGALARRRSAATLISYLTPPVARAGLYRELAALRETLQTYRGLPPGSDDRDRMRETLQAQAVELELAAAEPAWSDDGAIMGLVDKLAEMEAELIPYGLHVLGAGMPDGARKDYLSAIAEASEAGPLPEASVDALMAGESHRRIRKAGRLAKSDALHTLLDELAATNRLLTEDHELPAVLRALDGGFIRPAPGGDLLRNPAVLPTGRNVHGFDPFAIPSAFALRDGAAQAERLLARHLETSPTLPASVALVLWGSDNLKSGGSPIAQVLALLGARPRFDSYGRLCGAELIPLEDLGRPRIDVLITLSGIFRDLLPLQTKLLAEAAFLAASADEPLAQNYVRAHALAYQERHQCDLQTAALRVFSNAEGAYGANVNQLVEAGTWEAEDELADAYAKRKCFAYGADGAPIKQEALLEHILGDVDLAYQNLESVELGVTTIDHYFDTLGGIGRAARRARSARGEADAPLPIYIGDQTKGPGRVRSLTEQVALESRTRSLNPKWAEAMLEHGAEGVRQIEAQVTNTLGWSATTSQVDPWVYRELTKTYVLDEAMRERLAELNPAASAKLTGRLLEASERRYWQPDPDTLAALEAAGDELEDRLEGLPPQVA